MMRVVMAALAVASSTWPALAEAPSLEEFRQNVTAQLLEGPLGAAEIADYRARLPEFAPEDRLRAIIFLRRSGVMEGASLPVRALLRPSVNLSEQPYGAENGRSE